MGTPYQWNQMLEVMNRNGLRITEQRRTLVKIFIDSKRCLSPKDVYEQMSKLYPSVSFGMVYRNLRILSDLGLLEQFYFMDGGLKFKRSCSPRHHHHLICLQCEKTVPLDFCPMDHPIDLPQNFKIIYHRFEIYGLCGQCQQQTTAITKTS